MSERKQDKLYLYNRHIADAKLDGLAKGLLYFYANVYNWTHNRRSYWSQRAICASVGMSPNTYQKKRKYLEKLGWIKVENRGRNRSCLVQVLVGVDDPDYDNRCWASGYRRAYFESELISILKEASAQSNSAVTDQIDLNSDLDWYSEDTGTTNITTERIIEGVGQNSFTKSIHDEPFLW